MSYPKTTYKLIKDCFVGKEGDIIEVDESGESSWWHNKTRGTTGSPFVEYKLSIEVRE